MAIGYDKNGNIIEIYGLPTGGGSGEGVSITQVRAEIAKNIGKGIQLGFDGTLSGNILTFEPPSSSSTYEIKENYDYEIDLSFQATTADSMNDDIAIVIKNGDDTIYFWTVKDTPATWGDLKDIYTYNTSTGYRWLFKARFHVTSSGANVFYIFPAVDNSLTSVQLYSDGSAIYDEKGGTSLTFSQIYNLISNKYNLVNINFGDMVIMYPAFYDDDAICFSNTYIVDGYGWFQRIIINKDDDVLYNEYKSVKPTDYATTTTGGVVKVDGETIFIDSNGVISTTNNEDEEASTTSNKPIFVNEYIEPEWRRIDYNLGLQIDMQYWLPDNTNDYECTFEIAGEHQSSIYNIVKITAYSDYTANQGFSSSVYTVIHSQQLQDSPSFSKQPYIGYFTIPISTGRYLYIDNKSDKNEVYVSLKLISYRKI